jgi:xanthine dehydrogenase YagT iron-sulfur-binding subunit
MSATGNDPLHEFADSASDSGVSHPSRRKFLELAGATTILATPRSVTAQAVTAHATEVVPAMVGVHLTINGRAHSLDIDPRQSLLDVLRERLDLTGTKKGCNQGACGACTILVDGRRIVSCLTLAVMHDGAEITTIEGLLQGEDLHPLQAALIEYEGFQCGYCTPGQIMSGLGCISEGHASSIDDIRFWMSGNICRCGAYPGIVAAITSVAGRSKL